MTVWAIVVEFEDGDEMELPVDPNLIERHSNGDEIDFDALFGDMSDLIHAERLQMAGNDSEVKNFYLQAIKKEQS